MTWSSPASAIDMPATPTAQSIQMSLTRITGLSQSNFTAEQQVFKWPGEYWQMQFNMPPVADRAEAEQWIAWALKLEGQYGTFLAGDPSGKTPRGALGGTPVVDGGGQTGNNLNIRGCTELATGWGLTGDYFQIGSGSTSRLHKLTKDIDTDSNGDATLEFAPALRYSPADGAALTFTNARGVFRMSSNVANWTVDMDHFYQFGFTAMEAL